MESALQNTERPESAETAYQSYDAGFFDPMSFLGIFDNFDLEIGAIGGMNHGLP